MKTILLLAHLIVALTGMGQDTIRVSQILQKAQILNDSPEKFIVFSVERNTMPGAKKDTIVIIYSEKLDFGKDNNYQTLSRYSMSCEFGFGPERFLEMGNGFGISWTNSLFIEKTRTLRAEFSLGFVGGESEEMSSEFVPLVPPLDRGASTGYSFTVVGIGMDVFYHKGEFSSWYVGFGLSKIFGNFNIYPILATGPGWISGTYKGSPYVFPKNTTYVDYTVLGMSTNISKHASINLEVGNSSIGIIRTGILVNF